MCSESVGAVNVPCVHLRSQRYLRLLLTSVEQTARQSPPKAMWCAHGKSRMPARLCRCVRFLTLGSVCRSATRVATAHAASSVLAFRQRRCRQHRSQWCFRPSPLCHGCAFLRQLQCAPGHRRRHPRPCAECSSQALSPLSQRCYRWEALALAQVIALHRRRQGQHRQEEDSRAGCSRGRGRITCSHSNHSFVDTTSSTADVRVVHVGQHRAAGGRSTHRAHTERLTRGNADRSTVVDGHEENRILGASHRFLAFSPAAVRPDAPLSVP